MTANELLATLRQAAPSVAFYVSREIDPHFRWDGDGPNPVDEGFDAYDVTVSARCIVGGKLIDGHVHMGGSYFKPDEPCDDLHGYLPQMLLEAATMLRSHPAIERNSPLDMAMAHAVVILKREMQDRYNEQRKELAK